MYYVTIYFMWNTVYDSLWVLKSWRLYNTHQNTCRSPFCTAGVETRPGTTQLQNWEERACTGRNQICSSSEAQEAQLLSYVYQRICTDTDTNTYLWYIYIYPQYTHIHIYNHIYILYINTHKYTHTVKCTRTYIYIYTYTSTDTSLLHRCV
jgi:hypothetical protein